MGRFVEQHIRLIIIGLSVAITLCMFMYGNMIIKDLRQLQASEVALFTESRNLDQKFREFQRALGFGGFIHNVKEYLFNRDSTRKRILEANIQELETVYSALKGYFTKFESAGALEKIDHFVSLIRQKYQLMIASENQHLSPSELNILLDIEAPEILSAIITLESLKDSYSKKETRNIKANIDGLVFDLLLAAVLLPITLFVGIYLAWLLNLEIRTKKELENARQLLSASEERFRLHYENTPMAYQSLDFNGYFLEVNPAWLETMGYTKDEVIGKSFGDFLLPELKDHFKYNFPRFKDKGEVLGVEFEMVKKDASIIIVRYNGRIGYDNDGNFKQTHCTFQDITDIRKTEEEKEQLEERLRQAQKMEAIGTLAGGIAHDFNNILGAILGYAEMVQEDCPKRSTMRSDIDRVIEASNRAKELVKQILTFSRQAETELMPVQCGMILSETIKLLRSSLPTTIRIEQNINNRDTCVVLADPTCIHQVTMNLCTNAYHAMEKTGGTLSIFLKKVDFDTDDLLNQPHAQAGSYVHLSVGDTGIGIVPMTMEKIFDPYFTTKETGKGTGMGLAIVHGIVKSYGGFISCNSTLAKGTVFDVFIPVHEVATLPHEESELPVELGSERILFIDDEEMLVEMGRTMLERLGYRVTVRTNSIDALATFQNQPDFFDLVITDQTMPGMTGSDLSRRILQIRPDIPIILCTGYSNLISEEQAQSLGIKGFAMKPLSKKEIAKLIRKVLKGAHPIVA